MNPARNRAKVTTLLAEIVGAAWDNVRAQNGPGIAVRKHRPGPDLSASLETTEEH